ncbi:hypothetical protein BDY21DRAFT_108685 [Lineolata rhizophorae]|uniref:Uncharacterized protein n=1 Tax=Lineolata rhizophorae TaxID=578093 RepID=A0A6A6NRT7_9PEZI|nr:hypothetical protein BDY21DRAFT_108685 [Lineolata rhizophorae]
MAPQAGNTTKKKKARSKSEPVLVPNRARLLSIASPTSDGRGSESPVFVNVITRKRLPAAPRPDELKEEIKLAKERVSDVRHAKEKNGTTKAIAKEASKTTKASSSKATEKVSKPASPTKGGRTATKASSVTSKADGKPTKSHSPTAKTVNKPAKTTSQPMNADNGARDASAKTKVPSKRSKNVKTSSSSPKTTTTSKEPAASGVTKTTAPATKSSTATASERAKITEGEVQANKDNTVAKASSPPKRVTRSMAAK